jgi:DNA-binding GntR family transcriptional regulator
MELLSVTKSTVQFLRESIITGEFMPGQKLNEIEISSRFGISRPPLREAFRLLENEKLVHSIPRKGCFVTEVSPQECRQIFEVREMIESHVIKLLKARNIRELPHVESALASASGLWESSAHQYEKETRTNPFPDFHIALVNSSENHWVAHFYNSITSNLARYQFMCTYVPGVPDQAHVEHRQILDFIKRGEYDLANEFMKCHITSMLRYVEQVLSQKNWTASGVV